MKFLIPRLHGTEIFLPTSASALRAVVHNPSVHGVIVLNDETPGRVNKECNDYWLIHSQGCARRKAMGMFLHYHLPVSDTPMNPLRPNSKKKEEERARREKVSLLFTPPNVSIF